MSSEPIVSITASAMEVVTSTLAAEENSSGLGLWVEVSGVGPRGYQYDLFFQDIDGHDEDVVSYDFEGLTIIIPRASVSRLDGARLDFSADGGGGLVLVNPNQPTAEEMNPGVPAEVFAKGIETALAQRALEVLEASINPSIASHGGRADLVALDDDKGVAYVRLSGGCQGCAMSRMTLSQGIEKTLKDEIPELVGVIDVTDHASGQNPFYDK
jgi:Fe/S biogenesis protein NfuA